MNTASPAATDAADPVLAPTRQDRCAGMLARIVRARGVAPVSLPLTSQALLITLADARTVRVDRVLQQVPWITSARMPLNEAGTLIQAVRDTDLVLIDTRVCERLGTHALTRWRALQPLSTWVVVWDAPSSRHLRLLETLQARGVLCWTDGPEHVERAWRSMHRGELWFPRTILQQLYFAARDQLAGTRAPPDSPADPRPDPTLELLTPREREVAHLLSAGHSNKEIARHLGIAVDTVKKHVQRIFEKRGVHRRGLVMRQSAVDHDHPA